MRLGGSICPKPLIKAYMKRMADPLKWIHEGNDPYVDAFFGSRAAWESIPGWDAPIKQADSEAPAGLPVMRPAETDLAGVMAFAAARGGTCTAQSFEDPTQKLDWTCGAGHRFEASPNLLMGAGYWCPTCTPSVEDTSGWKYETHSVHDPLLASFL
jgi:hypothetical protein